MIGVIADDVTGATDVASALRGLGLQTLLAFGVPTDDSVRDRFDAVVVAQKTRNLPPADAVSESSRALDWLKASGAHRFYVKYCSTFDSNAAGNIGPVTEALAAKLESSVVVTTPSSPTHGRTVYRGHLFVGDSLLSDSPMRDHPLTPMTDSSIPRLLGAQSTKRVGLLGLETVRAGEDAIRGRIADLERQGIEHVVADAIEPEDLATLGRALADAPLAAGAVGLIAGIALAEIPRHRDAGQWLSDPASPTAIIAGSCSQRTLEQIDRFRATRPTAVFHLDSSFATDPHVLRDQALSWFDSLDSGNVPLIYSSLAPGELRAVQQRLGATVAGRLFEEAAGLIAEGLVQRGVTRLVIAGGETSGAVIASLDVDLAEVGPEVATGVPWIRVRDRDLDLALKSGNFGGPDFFAELVDAHDTAGDAVAR